MTIEEVEDEAFNTLAYKYTKERNWPVVEALYLHHGLILKARHNEVVGKKRVFSA